jgi:hypothetical protein
MLVDRTIKPWDQTVEKGGPNDQRGRLIGRTKGGMNCSVLTRTAPHAGRCETDMEWQSACYTRGQ